MRTIIVTIRSKNARQKTVTPASKQKNSNNSKQQTNQRPNTRISNNRTSIKQSILSSPFILSLYD